MTTVSFSWQILPDPEDNRRAYVLEKAEHIDDENKYGPMPGDLAEAFIRTRREIVYRQIRAAGGVKLFEPPEGLN